jgi:hypothetical protein
MFCKIDPSDAFSLKTLVGTTRLVHSNTTVKTTAKSRRWICGLRQEAHYSDYLAQKFSRPSVLFTFCRRRSFVDRKRTDFRHFSSHIGRNPMPSPLEACFARSENPASLFRARPQQKMRRRPPSRALTRPEVTR